MQDIQKTYGDGTHALKGIDFEVKKGEKVIILGHNGSGKSTLFKVISSFEKPTQGKVLMDNNDLTQLNSRQLRKTRKRIGMVFQHFYLVNNLSVFQNVLFGAMGKVNLPFKCFAPFASNELRKEAIDCLERVGLEHLAKRRADQLSGGQQQRVAIARMLMQDPDIILADEPIASLDPKAGKEVMDLLWSVATERNITVISILHQMEVAKEYGERIIALKNGALEMDSPISHLNDAFYQDLYNQSQETKASSEQIRKQEVNTQ